MLQFVHSSAADTEKHPPYSNRGDFRVIEINTKEASMLKAAAALVALGLVLYSLPSLAGTIVEARCGCKSDEQGRAVDCACSVSLPLGGGMSNYKTVDWFPGYCAANKSLVLLNRKQPGTSKPPCPGPVVPYDDPSLIRRQGKPLPSGEKPKGLIMDAEVDYFCPATGRYDLHFYKMGVWD